MPPTLTVRLPVAVVHFRSFVDQYWSWRGATWRVTDLGFAGGEMDAIEGHERADRELHALGNFAGCAEVNLRDFVGGHRSRCS